MEAWLRVFMEAWLRVFMPDKRSRRLSAQNIQFCGVCLYAEHGIYKMHEKPAKKSCKICRFCRINMLYSKCIRIV